MPSGGAASGTLTDAGNGPGSGRAGEENLRASQASVAWRRPTPQASSSSDRLVARDADPAESMAIHAQYQSGSV
jgi:hypothetical protein